MITSRPFLQVATKWMLHGAPIVTPLALEVHLAVSHKSNLARSGKSITFPVVRPLCSTLDPGIYVSRVYMRIWVKGVCSKSKSEIQTCEPSASPGFGTAGSWKEACPSSSCLLTLPFRSCRPSSGAGGVAYVARTVSFSKCLLMRGMRSIFEAQSTCCQRATRAGKISFSPKHTFTTSKARMIYLWCGDHCFAWKTARLSDATICWVILHLNMRAWYVNSFCARRHRRLPSYMLAWGVRRLSKPTCKWLWVWLQSTLCVSLALQGKLCGAEQRTRLSRGYQKWARSINPEKEI